MVGGTNNIQQTNETNNFDAKEKIQRGWKKIDHATKELIESDPNKNLIIVEIISSPSCDEEKRSVSLSTLKRLAKSRKQMKIVGIAKTIDEYDFRNVRVHLNESGVTKLVQHINGFMKGHSLEEITKGEQGSWRTDHTKESPENMRLGAKYAQKSILKKNNVHQEINNLRSLQKEDLNSRLL